MNSARSQAHPTSKETEQILRRCGLEVPSKLIDSVIRYSALLQKWNCRINLTSINSPTELIITHFAESFFAARYLEPGDSPILDIGSGAGFPGLAMKLCRPELAFYLLEPRRKKAAFLSTVRRELGISEVYVLNKTLQECLEKDFKEQPGLLTFRAVGDIVTLTKSGLRVARPGARVMLFLTTAKVSSILTQLPQIIWKQPISIPWSDQRVISLGQVN